MAPRNVSSILTPLTHPRTRAEEDVSTHSSSPSPPSKKISTSSHDTEKDPKLPQTNPMRAMTGHAVNQYLHLSHNLTTPLATISPYGYNYKQGAFPIERISSLALMQTKVRRAEKGEEGKRRALDLFTKD